MRAVHKYKIVTYGSIETQSKAGKQNGEGTSGIADRRDGQRGQMKSREECGARTKE